MSNEQSKPDSKTGKPQTRPRPTPKSSLPAPRGGVFGRPFAATSTQRKKRRADRAGGTITAKKLEMGEGELMLFGTIGEDFYGDGITGVSFNAALKDLGDVSKIRLRINSGGGDVFDATAIYNALVKHDAHVTVEIEGVAASAATLIAMAGDKIHISENAHFMIHAASGIAWGNAEQLRQYLKLLDNADELIRLTYSARTGLSNVELVGMMDHDNWMTAKQAHDLGFVDAIDSAKSVTPHVTPDNTALNNAIRRRPASIKPERLAAMSSDLLSLAASVRPAKATKPTGSSPQSVVPREEENEMKLSAKLRAKCVAAGMSDKLNDEDAYKWYEQNEDAVLSGTKVESTENGNGALTADAILSLVEAREKKAAAAKKSWRAEVDANITLAFGTEPPAGLREKCYDLQDDGVETVRAAILAARKEVEDKTPVHRISFNKEQPRDRHVAAIKTGLMARCLANGDRSGEQMEKQLPSKDRPDGWKDFAQMPLGKLAEECLYADGYTHETIRRLNNSQIAQLALGFQRQVGIRAEGGLHTTGTLAEITRDALNKVLTAAYEEAPQTWRGPMRQAASVSDFKEKHVVKLSAASNVPIWTDGTDPNQVKLTNEKEKYAVEARAETISFSWQFIVNDDVDAVSRVPQLMGNAFSRTVNATAWAQVTGNPTMADGQALFLETPAGNRLQSNYITGSATPTNTTIGSMRKLMRLMRGLNKDVNGTAALADDVLNLTPFYIVGPAALEELILKQVFSGADPAASGNAAVFNTSRNLTPIIEPLLDGDSSTAWYLFASPSTVDTIEVTFLQGQETPVAHEYMDDKSMSQNFTLVQTFAAKAIEWRSIIKHKGAS